MAGNAGSRARHKNYENHKNIGVIFFAALFFLFSFFLLPQNADAHLDRLSLVVIQSQKFEDQTQERIRSRLVQTAILNRLAKYYQEVEFLEFDQLATGSRVEWELRQNPEAQYDLFWLEENPSVPEETLEALRFERPPRLVFIESARDQEVAQYWKGLGSSLVVNRPLPKQGSEGTLFLKFLSGLEKGNSVYESLMDAIEYSEHWRQKLEPYTDQKGFKQHFSLEPNHETEAWGEDFFLDQEERFEPSPVIIESLRSPFFRLSENKSNFQKAASSRPSTPKTYFEELALRLYSEVFLTHEIDFKKLPSLHEWVKETSAQAWGHLSMVFMKEGDGDEEGDEIWIDSETLYYVLEPFRLRMGTSAEKVFEQLEGIRLRREGDLLKINILFKKDFEVLLTEKTPESWALYKVSFPKVLALNLQNHPGELRLWDFAGNRRSFLVYVQIPWFPDQLRPRRINVNLVDGNMEFQAGMFSDWIQIVGQAHLYEGTFDGVDTWESFYQTFSSLFGFRWRFSI